MARTITTQQIANLILHGSEANDDGTHGPEIYAVGVNEDGNLSIEFSFTDSQSDCTEVTLAIVSQNKSKL